MSLHSTKVERGDISEIELASILDTLKCIMKGLKVIFASQDVFDRKISNLKLHVDRDFL